MMNYGNASIKTTCTKTTDVQSLSIQKGARNLSKKDYDGIAEATKQIPLASFEPPPQASRSSGASVAHTPVVTAQPKFPNVSAAHTPVAVTQSARSRTTTV